MAAPTILASCLFVPLFARRGVTDAAGAPSIVRPEYVGKATAQEGSEPWVQTPEVIEKMRVAGRIAAGRSGRGG